MALKTPAVAERRRTLRVLIVGGPADEAQRVREVLAGDGGFLATVARSATEAALLLEEGSYDVALVPAEMWVDQQSPLTRYLREHPGDCAVLLIECGEPVDAGVSGPEVLGREDVFDASKLCSRLTAAHDETRALRRRDTMVRWLEREARTDHLTGMYNRRVFDEHLREACDTARRLEQPTTLIIGDLVDTRAVNEAHGHDAGDDLIRRAAQAVSRCVRAKDFAARVGGDDFAVILRGADFELGKLVTRRIAQEAERQNSTEWSRLIPVTFAFGVATGRNCQPGELFVAADRALHDNQSSRPVVTMLWPRIENDGPSVA